jgi:hypothetical protein
MEGGHNICKCVWGLTIKKSNQQHRGLRARRERPGRRTADERDELAAPIKKTIGHDAIPRGLSGREPQRLRNSFDHTARASRDRAQ